MPNAAIHPTPQELTAFALGKLADAASAAVAGHLEKCAACREVIERLPADSFVGKVHSARPSVSSRPARAGNAPNAAVPSAPPKNLPPELARYGKYRFVRELGRGGMGVVYQAEQTVMGRAVAVKVINPSVLDHPDALPRFQSEVRAAAKLDHPNIVRAYDAEQVGSMHLLVMEYIEGTSLAELVKKKGPLSSAYACHYVRQAALGLQHAFEQGMVHRDIKPQNLMVNARGQVKVLDFGLARMRSERKAGGGLTQADAFMGTPEYVAPEQATDARSADTRADIYSLGCTLFFLLTGRPPFQEDTIVKQILAQIEKEAPALSDVRADVPAELSAVVARMLAKDPAQRFQTPIEVEQAVAAFVKPGAKRPAAGGSASTPGVSSPRTGTMILADTNQINALLQDVPGKTPAQDAPASAGGAFEGLGEAVVSPKKATPARKAAMPARKKWWIGGSVAVGLLLLGLLGRWAIVLLRVETPNGTLLVEMNDKEVEARIKNGKLILSGPDGKVRYTLTAKDRSKQLEAGAYKIRVEGADGLVLDTPQFTIKKGDQVTVRVTLAQPDEAKDRLASLVADRKAAAYALSLGGTVRVSGEERYLKTAADLPVEVFRLTHVDLSDNKQVSDSGLAKFKDCKNLDDLRLFNTQVSDAGLAYFKDCKNLVGVDLRSTKVSDAGLAHLDLTKLQWLELADTQVSDAGLAHFKKCKKLTSLGLQRTKATAKGVKELKNALPMCRIIWEKGAATLLPPISLDPDRKAAEWVQQVAAMTPAKQVEAVVARLKERNPGFDGKVEHKIEGGQVVSLHFSTDRVTDISPLRALPELRELYCGGTWEGKRQLADLTPLKGMKLTHLHFAYASVSDLSPLKDMKLTFLDFGYTRVSDLSPLKDMRPTQLVFAHMPVNDAGLAQLQRMSSLRHLRIFGVQITDAGLAHLKDLTGLESLALGRMKLTGAGLVHLKGMTRLQYLGLFDTTVTDAGLVHLKGLLSLRVLELPRTKVSDAGLEHLAGLKNLARLDLNGTAVTDKGVAKLKAALPKCNITR